MIEGIPENLTLDKLKELLDGGYSYSHIAQMYGSTRSAIAGVIYRLRAQGDLPPSDKPSDITRVGVPKPRKSKMQHDNLIAGRAPRQPREVAPKVVSKQITVQEVFDEDADGVSIMELNHLMCACVVGRRKHVYTYCGEPRGDNSFRMCDKHAAAYLVKPAVKKKPKQGIYR